MKSSTILRKSITVGALLLAASFAGDARALTDEEVFSTLPLDFSNPGARALGLGGAQIAAADDGGAAEANPAALSYVGGIELFGEWLFGGDGRGTAMRGAAGSTALPAPELPYMDLQAGSLAEEGNLPSFLSLALPLDFGRRRTTLALSRRVALDTGRAVNDSGLDFALDGFPLWINPDAEGGPAIEQYTVTNTMDGELRAELVNYNVGLAFEVVEDLSLGVTATLARLDLSSRFTGRIVDPRGALEPTNPRADDDDDGLYDDILRENRIDDSASALTYTLGLHYHPTRLPAWRFGFVYHRGAELETRQTRSSIDARTGAVRLDPFSSEPLREVFVNRLRVPDRWGVGVAATIRPAWLIAFDIERIEYRDLMSGFEPGRSLLTGPFLDGSLAEGFDLDGTATFGVANATVFRLGVEHRRVVRNWGLGFRAGLFNDPDSTIHMTAFDSGSTTLDATVLGAYGRRGEEQYHFTGGLSATTPAGLELQFAGDFSDAGDRFLVTAIWRFRGGRR